MQAISESYTNSICEIKNIENELIAKGTISKITDEFIEVRYPEDEVHLLTPNSQIKLCVINERLGFKVLVGTVFVGTNSFVKIVEVMTLMDFEKRDYFRIDVSVETTAYKDEVESHEIYYTKVPSFDIRIHNLSLCGVFFTTEEYLNLGDRVYILLQLAMGATIFPCDIVRHQQKSELGFYGYGCQFVNPDQRKSDQLYKFIFNKQLEFLKSKK